MDPLQLVFSSKAFICAIILLAGSIMDIRTRRIHDETWMLLILACMPLLGWEMWLKGASENPWSMLGLLLPVGGMLFILFGYPEPSELMKGSVQDIFFTFIYFLCILGPVLAYLNGDRSLIVPILVSFVFMAVYFALYQIPVGGTRILHGGADAKCMMALAAVFPWYVEDLIHTMGPFYGMVAELPGLGYIFPIHLSVLFNGAVITAVALILVLPVLNLMRGDVAFPRMFTSLKMDTNGISGSHVWVILEHTKKKKVEPTDRIERRLKEMGEERVWTSPKIPFIFSLFIGFLVQMVIGNIVALIFLGL